MCFFSDQKQQPFCFSTLSIVKVRQNYFFELKKLMIFSENRFWRQHLVHRKLVKNRVQKKMTKWFTYFGLFRVRFVSHIYHLNRCFRDRCSNHLYGYCVLIKRNFAFREIVLHYSYFHFVFKFIISLIVLSTSGALAGCHHIFSLSPFFYQLSIILWHNKKIVNL